MRIQKTNWLYILASLQITRFNSNTKLIQATINSATLSQSSLKHFAIRMTYPLLKLKLRLFSSVLRVCRLLLLRILTANTALPLSSLVTTGEAFHCLGHTHLAGII